TLHMQVKDEALPPMPFPPGGLKKQEDGSQPRNVEYRNEIALDQLKVAGKKLEPGAEVEYWLEATDQCDFPPPGPNGGRSEKFTAKRLPPAEQPPPDAKNEQPQEKQPNQENATPQDQPKNDGKQDQPPKQQDQPKNDKQEPAKPQEQPKN